MPDIYDLADAYKQQLLELDAKAARQMANAYKKPYAEMQRRLAAVTALIRDARDAGDAVDPAWLFQQARWKEAYSAIRDEMSAYNRIASGITTDAQERAVNLGRDSMSGLLSKSLGQSVGYSFTHPNDAAMRAMVGFAGDGSPLFNLFRNLGPETAAGARSILQTGLGLGTNPIVLAHQLEGPLSVPLWRSLTIARTETLRAYREAERQTMLANEDVLEGWVWHAARDPRTCSACWSMHGKFFPIVNGAANDAPA